MSHLAERIHAALNRELIKRMLVQYFVQKGFEESFDQKIYPPTIQDLPQQVPQLASKIEIEPYVEDIDPRTGMVRLGWNLFILGTKRQYIGESTHTSLNEVQASVAGPLNNQPRNSLRNTTPRKIVEFIVKVLGDSKNGDVTAMPKLVSTANQPLPISTNQQPSGYFRKHHRPVL